MMRKIIFCSLVFLVAGAGTGAGGTTGAEFLRIDVPASSAALGAGTAAQGGSPALVWNPAGIAGQNEASLSFTHLASFADTAYEQLEGVYPGWLGGSWALRIFYASTYDFMEINEYGEEMGNLENYDMLVHLAHARNLGQDLRLGMAVKLFESLLAGYTSQGLAVDIGAQYHIPFWPLSLGIAVQNLGSMSAFETEADPLPALLLAGAAIQMPLLSGHSISLRLDLQQPLAGEEEKSVLLGLAYSLHDLVCVRAGYRFADELGSLSLGAGVKYDEFGLDYAYQPFNGLGTSHRFTFTYYLALGGTRAPVPHELEAKQPGLAASTTPMELKVASRVQPKIKTLTVLPRKYEGKLFFKTPDIRQKPKDWKFEIRDYQGNIIKQITGAGQPPEHISWDGKDMTGRLVPQAGKYKFVFQTSGKTSITHSMPQLEPVLKLRFADGAVIEPAVRFRLSSRPEVKQWRLTVRQRRDPEPVRLLSGEGELPAEIMWDGKREDGHVSDSRALYKYELAVAFTDGSEAVVSEVIQAVPSRQVPAPAGQNGILIYGILFDFNSAVLIPEMTDKCLAAAEIIHRYPKTAKAVCEGHADEIGTVQANLKISRERAHMVAAFLAKHLNVSQENISLIGYGKDKPENKLKTEKGRARNRRVEIRLHIPQPEPAKPKSKK